MSGVPIAVGPFYGALYFSAILSVTFYGVTCMQTFFYYIHYQDDQRRTKTFVTILWALDTIHQALIISGVYKSLMSGLVNPQSFFYVVQELNWELLVSTLVSVPTQGFFVYQIYLFSGKSIVAPLIWFPLGLWQLVAALLYVGKAVNAKIISTLGDAFFTGIAISYCAVAAAVDILIALCLTYLLVRRRAASGFKNSARILQLLTVFAFNSGIWTAIFALLTIILLRAFPTELTYVVFDFPLCSIYCNTLLANLNARAHFRNQVAAVNVGADLITNTCELSTGNNPRNAELSFFVPTHQADAHMQQETKNTDIIATMYTTDATQLIKAPAL